MTTVAGDGEEGSDDGVATEASFSFPGGISLYYDSSEGIIKLGWRHPYCLFGEAREPLKS